MKNVFVYFFTADEAIITKHDTNITQIKVYTNFKISETKGAWPRSRDPLLHFGTPSFYISGISKVRDFKFGTRIDHQAYKWKNTKVGQKGRGLRHVTYF